MTKLADSLAQWTEWTHENILPLPSLPPISGRDVNTGGTVVEVWDEPPAQIRESVETFLAQHYGDVAARFVVLSFLWELIHLEYGFKDLEAEQRAGFREILKDLVCLVDLQRLADPKIISWEIVNACSVAAWDLGFQLYDRLKDPAGLSEPRFRALRGQFFYLSGDWESNERNLDEDEQSLSYWSPELPGDTFDSVVMSARATALPERQKQPSQEHLTRFRNAADDLKRAIDLDPSLPALLHLMLAKSSLLTKDYLRAGQEYEHVLKADFWKVWPVDARRMRQPLYECAARGYERAGYTEKAELVLKQCLGELPESKGISLRLASLYTQPPHADYKAAYEALRQELL